MRLILRRSSMSSRPEVFSLVRIRSKPFLWAMTRAAVLSVVCWIAHASGSRMFRSCPSIWESPPTTSAVRTGKGRISMVERALISEPLKSCLVHFAAWDLGPLATRRPRSTEALVRGGAATPRDNDSTLQTKAVLIVVVVADSKSALVAKAGVEILSLDGAQGEFLVYLYVKPPTYCHGKSVLGVSVAPSGVNASCRAALASDRQTVPSQVELKEWPEGASISKSKPRSEQISKLTPVSFGAHSEVVIGKLAAPQVGRNAEHAGEVNCDRAAATKAIKAV